MVPSGKHILIVAGEESGDMRAASLVHAIKASYFNVSFSGIAGARCRQEGVQTFADISDLAVIGFSEVIKNLSRIKRIFNRTLDHARTTKPDLAVLVDYPGFNLRLAKELKKLGIKVVYYVSPQIWAWKESRVHLIKKVVDRMMVFFPFEKDLYAKYNYNADFVGHPLIDEVISTAPKQEVLKRLGLSDQKPVLGLLPGSREKEIVNLLPMMLKAAAIVRRERPDVQLVLLKAKNLATDIFTPILKSAHDGLKISEDYYNTLNACDAAIVCSGTATLETALMQKPLVVVYKTSWITSVLVRLLIKIRFVSLVNIVAQQEVVKELIQEDATVQRIATEASSLFNVQKASLMREKLAEVRKLLGNPGASTRAAGVVIEELKKASS